MAIRCSQGGKIMKTVMNRLMKELPGDVLFVTLGLVAGYLVTNMF